MNGNDVEALVKVASAQPGGKPLVILAYTNPYCGIDLLENRFPKLHYVRFKSEEERSIYAELLDAMNKEQGI